MTLLVLVALVGRILCSSGASLLQKQLVQAGLRPLSVVTYSLTILLLLALPNIFLSTNSWLGLGVSFWWAITLAGLLDAVGNVLLVRAMGAGELSVVGPLNSYKPVVGLILGAVLLSEMPSWLGVCGVLVIVVGTVLLSAPRRLTEPSRANEKNNARWLNGSVRDRMLSIVLTASASIALKDAIQQSNATIVFGFWALSTTMFSWLIQASLKDHQQAENAQTEILLVKWKHMVALGASFYVLQYLTIWIFGKMHVGYALALFQLGSILQVYLGYRYFGEREIVRRVIAAAIMTLGAALVLLG